jgi:bifunctional DNA primase/polymerase-like protein
VSSPQAVRQAALEAWDAGLCVVPPKEDGTKAPIGNWKDFQAERPTRDRIESYYEKDRHGIGLLGGPVSGQLEIIDIENPDIYGQALRALEKEGLSDLIEDIERGYLERCPRGGVHWIWRTDIARGNTKIAQTASRETLIETRGTGGFAIVAPSHGPVHPSGLPYERMMGQFGSIRYVEQIERDSVIETLAGLDQSPRHPRKPDIRFFPQPGDGLRPGDDLNARGDWHSVLESAGWSFQGEVGEQQYWRRPDKDRGHSAVLHTDSGLFVPFSTSTPFPEIEEGYTLFSVYAYLHHEGDFRAAAERLRSEGYGKERKIWTPPPEGSLRGSEVLSLEMPEIATLPVLGREGLIMEQGANLLYSFPKVGKTEFVRHLIREWILSGRTVLYLTEEPLWFWTHRLQLYDHAADFWSSVMFCPAFGWDASDVLEYLDALGETFDVVVVDTIRNCVGYQEGDGDKSVNRTIQPLIGATRGSTLICLYHARKMPGEGGRDISGHHSLFGVFDRAIQLRPMSGEGNEDNRTLKVSGRLLGPTDVTTMHYMMTPQQHFKALDVQQIKEEVGDRFCKDCGNSLTGRQKDFCSDTCRKRWSRKEGS